MKKIHCLLFLCLISPFCFAQKVGDKLPAWQKGYMDIHHINTGCGECTYCILPDGTTMMIDAGENDPKPIRHVSAKPNDSKTPGEWIVNYINNFSPEKNQGLDYALITHFHSDHMGGVLKTKNASDKYYNTGIITVAENIRIGKLIDRGYPNYDYLCDHKDKVIKNYFDFLRNTSRRFTMERFKSGRDDQFRLVYDTSYISMFKIQNLYSNGDLWTGKDTQTQHLFPNLKTLQDYDIPRENSLSCAIKISYGDFSYYTGGDISGYPRPGRSSWHDVESKLAPVVGEVDVCVVNHHGNNDATNDTFISTLKPRVFLILASDALHPNHTTLYRMLSKQLYPQDRDVFATNLHQAAEIVIGELTEKMKSKQGHIVIRVLPEGKQYMVYILEDSNTKRKIKNIFGPYDCKIKNK